MDIIAAYREAGTFRGAAEIAGTTHKTVKRVIARHEAGGAAPERAPRGHNYDGVAALVAERVGKTAGRISAKRLLPAARAAGYAGSDRNFRRLVASADWMAESTAGDSAAEICAVPAERLVIERELLAPLPSLRASIGRQVIRKVDRLSCVRFGSARYSVPARLIGTEVAVRTGDGRLLVIMTATGEVVTEHILVAPGEASVRDEHYGGPRPRRGGQCGPERRQRRNSARSGRSRSPSSPEPPPPGAPGWEPSWPS